MKHFASFIVTHTNRTIFLFEGVRFRLEKKRTKNNGFGVAIGTGVAIGAGVGVALDSIALGIAIGIALGVSFYNGKGKKE